VDISFARFDKKLLRLIKEIGAHADLKKVPAYVVGGFVRDYILKRENLDLDIVIDGDAISLARSLAKKQKAKVIVYKHFGTATLYFKDGRIVDLAMARKESYLKPGALPKVKGSTINDDLIRRDFTINAMAVVINRKDFGKLIDLYGGMNDIKSKKICVLHEQSFQDDSTRILRAIRFEQRFNFCIERKTLYLLKQALNNGYKLKMICIFLSLLKFLIDSYSRLSYSFWLLPSS